MITFENINTEWFDANALRLPNYRVGRVNFGKGRSYIRINEDGSLEAPLRLYTSLTTAINTCAPMEDPLLEWYCKHGKKEAERLTKVAQHYGTLMHLEVGRFLREAVYDLDSCEQVVEAYTSSEGFWEPECKEWVSKLKYDMAAFMQFAFDYEIKPLGIEYVLLSDKGFGTLIDLVCEMTVMEDGLDYENPYKSGPRKGEPREVKVPKTIRAIVNFKSGRHGFYRTHGIQVEAERQLWEENFPDLPLDAAFNWSPKDWTAVPGYNLRDWTGDVSLAEVDHILGLAQIRYASKAENKVYLNIGGVVSTKESLLSALGKETIEEWCHRNYGNTPTASVTPTPSSVIPEINSSFKPAPLPI
jgi:hypothetical protein